MKKLCVCVLLAALLCCGCNANEKPEPIHLDEGGNGALSLLFPEEGNADATEPPAAGNSEVLGNLLSQGGTVPNVEGYETRSLRDTCDELTEQVEAALADDTADRDALRTEISRLSGAVSLTAASVQGDKGLSEADKAALTGFYAHLAAELQGLLEKLK